MMHTPLYCPQMEKLDHVNAINAIHQAWLQLSSVDEELGRQNITHFDNVGALANLAAILASVGHPGFAPAPIPLPFAKGSDPADVDVIRCLVIAVNASGATDYVGVRVKCTRAQYEGGEHFDAASNYAEQNSYTPITVLDECDSNLANAAEYEKEEVDISREH